MMNFGCPRNICHSEDSVISIKEFNYAPLPQNLSDLSTVPTGISAAAVMGSYVENSCGIKNEHRNAVMGH